MAVVPKPWFLTMGFKRLRLIAFGALISAMACNHFSTKDGKFTITDRFQFVSDTAYGLLTISNTAERAIEFTFRINGGFPNLDSEMFSEGKTGAHLTGMDSALQLLTFVASNTYHASSDTTFQQDWNPRSFLNSIGYGLCHERANLLASLLQMHGFRTRMVDLQTHVVLEFWNDGKWVLLDADRHMFYLNRLNGFASLEDLKADSLLIREPLKDSTHLRSKAVSQTGFMSGKMAVDYTASAPDYYEYSVEQPFADSVFALPSKSDLEILVLNRTFIGDVKLRLSERSEGNVHLPWVACYAVGPCTIESYEHRKSVSKNDTLWLGSASNLTIVKAGNGACIGFRTNTRLRVFRKNNLVIFASTDSMLMSYSNTYRTTWPEEFRYAQAVSMTDSLLALHDRFLFALEDCSGNDPQKILAAQLDEYLQFDDALSQLEQNRMRTDLVHFLDQLALAENSSVDEVAEQLCSLSPFGSYLLFTALRLNEVVLLKRKFREMQSDR